MRTSPGGRQLMKWDSDMWEKGDSGAYTCRECGEVHWSISNPSPNTIGGKRTMRVHQERHQ